MGKINNTAILAGILVGIGNIINITSDNKYIGAMLFSLALLVIMRSGAQLYTGQIGYFFDKKYSVEEYGLMFMHNIMGVTIATILGILVQNQEHYNKFHELATQKFSRSYTELLICGFMCGILMLIAVYCKKSLITVFCIMVFILSGYEHCVASFPFLLVHWSFSSICKFIVIIIGNSLGSIITYGLIK